MPRHHQHEKERHQEEGRGGHPVALAKRWYQVLGGRLEGELEEG